MGVLAQILPKTAGFFFETFDSEICSFLIWMKLGYAYEKLFNNSMFLMKETSNYGE
jgi:hypothetical protein